ncbi:MAG: hypothetical protein H0W01_04715 [Pseudonocardiales bacterium]|nr:hypothetical protein [Pseudonocardiales bacterium]
MGLTSDQADALSVLVDRAKQLRQQQGALPEGWVHDQAIAACGPIVAKPTSTDRNGWP